MGVLPSWDVTACVQEAERVAALGHRGVNITSDPQDQGSPDLANRAWDLLWEACSALDLPIHFHIGASLTTMTFFGTYPWASQQQDTALAIGGTLLFIGNARVVVNIITCGAARATPDAQGRVRRERVRLDPLHPRGTRVRDARERPEGAGQTAASPGGVLPAADVRDDLVRTHQPPRVIEAVGEDNIMFETDFPHPTCLFPDPLQTARENMRDLAQRCSERSSATTRASSTASSPPDDRRPSVSGHGGCELEELRRQEWPALEEPLAALTGRGRSLHPLAVTPRGFGQAALGSRAATLSEVARVWCGSLAPLRKTRAGTSTVASSASGRPGSVAAGSGQ